MRTPEEEQLAREVAFREGRSAQRGGLPEGANPYLPECRTERTALTDMQAFAWLLGWRTAAQAHPNHHRREESHVRH